MADDFADGSIAAANAIIGWLGQTYGPTVRRAAILAWDAGDMFEPALPAKASPVPAKGLRKAAVEQGFTGDSCDTCGSMQMKRTGTCLTCTACGTTTGCA